MFILAIKLILFDLGGVVFNRFNRAQFAKDIKADITPEEFGKYLYTENYFEKFEKSLATKEDYAKYVKTVSNSPMDISEIIYYYKKNLGNINLHSFKAFSEFKNMGLEVGILSNISYFWASEIDEVIKVLDADYIFYSYKIGMIKPYEKIYRYVLDNVPYKPEEIIFLDDNLNNIEAAKKMGIVGIQVKFDDMYEIIHLIKSYI